MSLFWPARVQRSLFRPDAGTFPPPCFVLARRLFLTALAAAIGCARWFTYGVQSGNDHRARRERTWGWTGPANR